MHRFLETKTWIFDLDNTLYPASCDLFAQIDVRMGAFISDFLQVDLTEARRVQKHYFKEHGTTLNGLMTEHGLEPGAFLDFVHDIDHSPVRAAPELERAIGDLPGRKIILTNGTCSHAQAVMGRLGVAHHFEAIYDIVATGYRPKPQAHAFQYVIEVDGLDPKRSVMFEDIVRNLEVPHDLGMTTVLVRAKGPHPDDHLGLTGTGEEKHVHHVTDDLAAFLGAVKDHV